MHSDADTVIISDIDAFPLKAEAVARLASDAEAGGICGLAQVANHKDPKRIYVGPMFFALKAKVFRSLGSPNLEKWKHGDVGQIITDLAHEKGISVKAIEPRFAIAPKWNFAGKGVFGVGTFYGELDFFHLFEARKQENLDLLKAVADGTIAGIHDFEKYIHTAAGGLNLKSNLSRRFKFPLFG